jgi:hypothetical protein
MTFKELKLKIKNEQKELARKISRGKALRKPKDRVNLTPEDKKEYFWSYGGNLYFNGCDYLRNDYRHRHIIYCNMFHNTPYDMIENPRDENKPDSFKLDRIRKEWESLLDEETVRSDS